MIFLDYNHERVVRIFISSTFLDMQSEREELVKYIFPELRKRCRERQVELTEVDLRWGLTDEQKAEGNVLPFCLAEIDRCRPYFIGLLGERYGYIPETIQGKFEQNQNWVKKQSGKSITEMEIMHGVLNYPEMQELSFFYFRDPKSSQSIEKNLEKSFGSTYHRENPDSIKKLNNLKERIRKQSSHFPQPVRENYRDAKELGQLILEDLWHAIEKRFPVKEIPSALEQERLKHENFASMRRKIYISNQSYYDTLNKYVEGNGLPLVLLGESGSGKSALISNWIDDYRKKHPKEKIIIHFIGSTGDSVDMVKMLRRIMEEIQ